MEAKGTPSLQRLTSVSWVAVSVTILGFVLPFALSDRAGQGSIGWNAALAWVIAIYSAARLGLAVTAGRQSILSITFWVYVYVWLGLVPFVQVTLGMFPWPGKYSDALVRLGLIVTLLGIAGFEVGYYWGSVVRAGLGSLTRRRLNRRRVVLGAYVSIALVVMVLAVMGGPAGLLASRVEFAAGLSDVTRNTGRAGSLVLHALLKVPLFVTWIALVCWWVDARRSLQPPLPTVTKALLILMTLLNLAVNSPLTSPRAWFGSVALTVVFVLARWRPRRSGVVWGAGLVVFFVLVFPYADLFRVAVQAQLVGFQFRPPGAQLVNNGDYSSFQQILNGLHYVGDHGFVGGRQFIGSLLVFVPRKIWQDKPLDTADLVAGNIGYTYKNLEMPLWGELYVDWGVFGVMIGFCAYGWLVARAQIALGQQGAAQTTLMGCVIPFYAIYQLFLLRGDLMSAIGWLLPVLGVALLVSQAAPRRKRLTRSDLVPPPQATNHHEPKAGQEHWE